ncbi:hypothetical protein F3Y22_tig00113726pilonHSYRG00216 [Hibiscus syriacus]|uniref:RNase H type-1 domain-containing protein n=1 Tax=Hibiscus syriacus TaxID=106335 RepID=A0A6A2WMG9_HIBSY|nr:hypothetical protein F3Y22_tig00113726pilonHSYRG00216 [Hibiscus syriacus]
MKFLFTFEKEGGLARNERQMDDFWEALDCCNMMDIGYTNTWFTWERGHTAENNIGERLDWGLANSAWKTLFPCYELRHLNHSLSDHFPLLLEIVVHDGMIRRWHFRFEASWLLENSCEEVKRLWNESTDCFPERLNFGVCINRCAPSISHLLFAYDSLIFGEEVATVVVQIKEILRVYGECSDQAINFDKVDLGSGASEPFHRESWKESWLGSGGKNSAENAEYIGVNGKLYVNLSDYFILSHWLGFFIHLEEYLEQEGLLEKGLRWKYHQGKRHKKEDVLTLVKTQCNDFENANRIVYGASRRWVQRTTSVFLAEAIDALHAVFFAVDLSFVDIIVESDSKSVIEKLRSLEPNLSKISAIVNEIKGHAACLRSCPFRSTHHSGNTMAHALAAETSLGTRDLLWVEEAPSCVEVTAS